MNKMELAYFLDLENTRIIYNGIRKLNERHWDEKDILKLVQEEYKECKEKKGDKEEWLPQNTMTEFFKFLCAGKKEPDENRIANMILLYQKVTALLEGHDEISLGKEYVGAYTELCKYMNNIAHSKQCYMIHLSSNGGHVLAHSSNEFEVDGESKAFHTIITKVHKAVGNLAEVGFEETIKEGENNLLIFVLHVSRRRDEKYKQTVCIVLEGADSQERQEIGKSILFLRQQLQELLERDLYALQHFQISYEAVMPLNSDSLKILHITDLHVSEDNEAGIRKVIRETDWKYEEGLLVPDLILITGDVVQGKNAASDMEINYEKAAVVIRELVNKLWIENPEAKEKIYDWKKRIIIIPGNHDYASMNELKASHINRATTAGLPADEEGSPMVKFGYFINFLQQLLDINMSEQIWQNLNEYRVYNAMDLEIICLNTVSEASMWRNNKMALDEKFIERLPKKNADQNQPFVICLGHHSPLYRNDYNADCYWSPGITNEALGLLGKIVETVQDGIKENSREKTQKTLEKMKESNVYASIKKRKETALYSDVTYLLKHGHEFSNERCRNIVNEYAKNLQMQEYDYNKYRECYGKLKEKVMPDIFLGGHTHELAHNSAKNIIEGPRFYNAKESDTTINYGILEIQKTNPGNEKKFTYTFVPDQKQIKEM